MQADLLKELIHAEKFKPFTIHLVDGRSFEIPHQDFVFLTRTGRTVVVNTDGDRVQHIDVPLIVSVMTTDKDIAAT